MGCLSKKYWFPANWSLYNSIMNSMWTHASAYALFMSSGLRLLAVLSLCHFENAVHMGEPIDRTGCECRNSSRALILFDFN